MAGRKVSSRDSLSSKIRFFCQNCHHGLISYQKVRIYNQLHCVSGPLTESEIGGSSRNRRKFFLCRMRSSFLNYRSVVRLFQEMKEYNLKPEEPSADHHPALAAASAFVDRFRAKESTLLLQQARQTQLMALPAPSIASFEAKARKFVSNNPPAQKKTSVAFKILLHPLDLCRNFCAAETASRKAQVLSNFPFRFRIPMYVLLIVCFYNSML